MNTNSFEISLKRFGERLDKYFVSWTNSGLVKFDIEYAKGVHTFFVDINTSTAKITTRSDHNATTEIKMELDVFQSVIDGSEGDESILEESTLLEKIKITGDKNFSSLIFEAMRGEHTLAKKKFTEIEKNYSNQQDINDIKIEYNISTARICECLQQCQPLLLKSTLEKSGWAVSEEKFVNRYGHIQLKNLPSSILGATGEFSTLKEAIDKSHSLPGGLYSGGICLPSSMSQDFSLPFLDKRFFLWPKIWLGKKEKICTLLHRDIHHSFIGQICGKKKFILYSPADREYLYPGPFFKTFQPVKVNPVQPDFQTYPAFKHAQKIEVCVNPGDLLIIPAGWFHATVGDHFTLSINYFMKLEGWNRVSEKYSNYLNSL